MPEKSKYDRLGFLRNTGMALAGAQLAGARPANAQVGKLLAANLPAKPGAHTSFASRKQIDAGLLSVGYAEAGPADGPPVILLHGWPYDIHSYVDVAPLLAAAGYRVIVPYMRGFGSTSFRSASTFRNGQQAVMAVDVIALMDALKVKRAVIGGFDLGSRTADIVAALWPQRCKALVSVSGYLITNLKFWSGGGTPLPPPVEYGWWYQYYFSTERGRVGYGANRYAFNKLIWTNVSPKWHFSEASYDRTAASFNNLDHVAIVIHNYRWRLSLAKGEAQYDALEAKLAENPVIAIPTITIASDFDGAGASGTAYRDKFSGKYSHRVLKGIGHNVPQEDPQAFAQAVTDVSGYAS
ncbi:MAG TPA: alpha/beta hydrolase [Candidatus Cybelea sp.]|jgi:pimeloyl-ACP methyl ester carboxylesterase